VAQWSGVSEPDDPLRADDPLVGAQHEDVLLGSGAADDDDPAAEYADTGQEDVDESPVSGAVLDDRPTTKLPPVVAPASAPEQQGRWAGAAPWAVFAAVAVVVITATTTLASWLQGPTAERQSFTGLIQPPPTSSVAPVAPAEPAAPPPTAEPEPQPEPDPDPEPARAERPTERPRPTRAQPAAPPPAAAVNAPASRTPKPEEEPQARTSAPNAPAAAGVDTAEKDGEKDSPDADTAKPADEEDSGSDE
jgi:outer membrane biosynthesis protein TonB